MVGKHIDTVFVDILPDVSRFASNADRDLKRSLKSVEKSVDDSAKEMEESFRESFQQIGKDVDVSLKDAERRIDRFVQDANGRWRDARGKFAPVGTRIGEGIVVGATDAVRAGAPGVLRGLSTGLGEASGPLLAVAAALGVQLAGAIAPAAAGLAASLPAAIGVAGAAIATLTLGLQGLGDALDVADDAEKFDEALKKLSPSARSLAIELRNLFPAFRAIQQSAAQGLFAGFQGEITRLISVIQAPLQGGLNDVGVALQMVAKEFIGFLTSSKGVELLNEIFKTTAIIIAGIAPVIKPLATGISNLIITALPFIQKLSAAFGSFLQRIGERLTKLAESGKLDEFFERALDALSQLGRIAENFGPILLGLFEALAPAGGDFLDIIERLTENLAEFLSDKDNVEALATAFSILGFFLTLNLELFNLAADAGRALGEIFNGITGATDQVSGAIVNFGQTAQTWFKVALESVQKVIGAIANAPALLASLGGKFLNAGLSLIKSFFSGLSSGASFAGNLASSVFNALKSALNSAIGRINSAISRISAALPISFPSIPMLASGGLTVGPTLAGLGETGAEMVLPLAGARGRESMRMIADAATSGGPAISFGPGSVVVSFEGSVPTESQAFLTGQAVGRGVVAVLERRDARMQVRRS